jgi:hypothetical protein
MFTKLSLLLLLLATFPRSASAYTPEEVKRGYEWCLGFLKMKPADQQRIAQSKGFTLAHGLQSCRFDRDRGLDRLQADEREYQRQLKNGETSSANQCTQSSQCGNGDHCIQGTCQDTINTCSSNVWCSPGQNCSNGRCND